MAKEVIGSEGIIKKPSESRLVEAFEEMGRMVEDTLPIVNPNEVPPVVRSQPEEVVLPLVIRETPPKEPQGK